MEAIVVYDSVWGNTKTVAAAIAQGLGPDVRAFATDTVPLERLATADLIVAGSPVYALRRPARALSRRKPTGQNRI
jgi:flavodoxin